ncbi:MAG: alkaline phosphatase family protein [Terriglobia bacterium]
MRKSALVVLIAVCVSFLFAGPWTPAETEVRRAYSKPKLVIVIVIDQFRYDYLARFRPEFVAGGFTRLLDGGANFINCRYNDASTVTCAGHATLFTGAYPALNGIIENNWYDPILHQSVYCATDLGTKLVGGEGAGASPKNLMGTTLGDEMRMASDFKSKVVAISLKDRSAVMPGGHTANAAYWYDAGSGHFVSSTYYMPELPEWVKEFNQHPPVASYCGKDWKSLPENPIASGKVFKTFAPDRGERCPDTRFLNWLHQTPYMTALEISFAEDAIRNDHLGAGPATDLLALSISENDVIGHAYGPYSAQVADVTLWTDRYLAQFFQMVDKTVGLNNVWIVLSADHGVAPNPDFIAKHHLGQGSFDPANINREVERALNQQFGQDRWIENQDEFYLYLNHEAMARRHLSAEAVEKAAARAAVAVDGVRAAFTRAQLMTGQVPATPLARKALNSFNSQRSGDVFLVLDPFSVAAPPGIHTTHGTPWSYDAQVPLIFWGDVFKPGTYRMPVQPVDLAATVGAALGITQPSDVEGKPLAAAMR